MELRLRGTVIYGLLLGIWLLLVGWQIDEHLRYREEARGALVKQAQDISTTLGIVLRSQRRFGGFVSKERLETSLGELVSQDTNELTGIALLNRTGDVVASAGAGIDSSNFSSLISAGQTESWGPQTVSLLNLVDLGTNLTRDIEGSIIFSRSDFTNRFGAPGSRRPPGPPPGDNSTNPPPPDMSTNPPSASGQGGPPPSDMSTNSGRPPDGGPPRFGRPRGMSPEDYAIILQEKGVQIGRAHV